MILFLSEEQNNNNTESMFLSPMELKIIFENWCDREANLIASAIGVKSDKDSHCFLVDLGTTRDGHRLQLSISVPTENANDMTIQEILTTYPKMTETALLHNGNFICQAADYLVTLGYSPEVSAQVGYMDMERFHDDFRASSPDNVERLKQEVDRLRRLFGFSK